MTEGTARPGWLILLVLVATVGAAWGPTPVRGAERPVTLTFWPSSNPEEIAFARAVIADWHALRPDVRIEMQPLPASRSTEEVLLAAIAGRTTPDIVANIYPGAVAQYVESGALIPLDRFPDFEQVMAERLPPGVLESFRSPDGHVYQVPWKTNPIMLGYNVGMLREAGVAPEQLATYEGFLEAGSRLVADLNGDGQPDRWTILLNIEPTWWQRLFDFYTLYVAASGGRTLLEGGRVAFANDSAVQVMAFLAELFARGLAPRSTFPGDPFLGGRVATVLTGPWSIPYWEANKPAGMSYGFRSVPVPSLEPGQPVWTYGDPKNIGIFTSTRHPELAWEFVKFYISRENDLRLVRITSQIPFRRDLLEDPEWPAVASQWPQLRPFLEQMRYTVGVDSSPHLVAILDAISSEYQYAAVLGMASPEEAIRNAAEAAEELLSW